MNYWNHHRSPELLSCRWKDGGTPLRAAFSGSSLALPSAVYSVTDVWSGESFGYLNHSQTIILSVPPMGVRYIRFNIVKILEESGVEESEICEVTNPGMSGWLWN